MSENNKIPFTLNRFLEIRNQIYEKAKSMSYDELEELANSTGFLTLLEDYPDLLEYLETLSSDENYNVTKLLTDIVQKEFDEKDIEEFESIETGEAYCEEFDCTFKIVRHYNRGEYMYDEIMEVY